MKESAVSFVAAAYGVPVEEVAAVDELRRLAELCGMVEDLNRDELKLFIQALETLKRTSRGA